MEPPVNWGRGGVWDRGSMDRAIGQSPAEGPNSFFFGQQSILFALSSRQMMTFVDPPRHADPPKCHLQFFFRRNGTPHMWHSLRGSCGGGLLPAPWLCCSLLAALRPLDRSLSLFTGAGPDVHTLCQCT